MNELIVTCPNESATRQVATRVAGLIKNGGFVELVGDVGSGKTTFVKALAKGTGYKGEVSSPSYTLQNIYNGEVAIHHFDLYRLSEPGLIKHELQEAINEDKSVVVVEWAKQVNDILPKNRITVKFTVIDENSRELNITLPEGLR